jgi:hypothetical protein
MLQQTNTKGHLLKRKYCRLSPEKFMATRFFKLPYYDCSGSSGRDHGTEAAVLFHYEREVKV